MRGYIVAETQAMADQIRQALTVDDVHVAVGQGRSSTHSLGNSLMISRQKPVVFYTSEPMSSDLKSLLGGRDYLALDPSDDLDLVNNFFLMPR